VVPDPIFADPRLAEIYDVFDGERSDLEVDAAIVEELGATTVLDVGCGTGSFACLLAGRGVEVIGLDPAAASLQVARSKPGADRVRWILGDASVAPPMSVDLAVMTGNVAQVFITDSEWRLTLSALRNATAESGWLVFESRDPDARAWEKWTPEHTRCALDVGGGDIVTQWTDLLTVNEPLVSFRHHYRFARDGSELISDSTLRFRHRDEITEDLVRAGFDVVEIRDAPDRPGCELVFLARCRLSEKPD
jgi:SAM-dependent methyltransferase